MALLMWGWRGWRIGKLRKQIIKSATQLLMRRGNWDGLEPRLFRWWTLRSYYAWCPGVLVPNREGYDLTQVVHISDQAVENLISSKVAGRCKGIRGGIVAASEIKVRPDKMLNVLSKMAEQGLIVKVMT